MANQSNTRQESRDAIDYSGGEFSTFVLEDAEDNRAMRFSMGFAVVAHLLFLFTPLISFSDPEVAPKKEEVLFVMTQTRFKQPPPPVERQIPEPQALKVPIPDPTPDEPEPWRTDEPEPVVVLPNIDDVFFGGIPAAPPEVAVGPIQVGGKVKAPTKVLAPAPQYTEIARKARVQGLVIVQAIIDKTGTVTHVKVLKTLPMGLEEEAVKAIKRWKFDPATLNGKPVDVYYNLTVNFRLQ
jgi:protein TonB